MAPPAPAANRDGSITRKLVTVRIVTAVRPIRGSRLDLVTVDRSWTVVASRMEYQAGQVVVYFEIDSFIPATDPRMWEYSSSFIHYAGQKGYHVQSRIIGGELSQGLVYPIEAFSAIDHLLEEKCKQYGLDEALESVMDMSFEDTLGVKKWEPPANTRETILGRAPSFFPRPGAPRAQNIPYLFGPRSMQLEYQITEKLDGVSMTVYCVNKKSVWGSSLSELPPDSQQEISTTRVGIANQLYDIADSEGDIYWEAAKQACVVDKIRSMGGNIAIQGELVGHGIKKNSMGFGPGDHQFFVFDIFDIKKQKHFPTADVEALCKKFDLPHVPIINYCKLEDFATDLDELLAKAEGVGMLGKMREGLVFKTKDSGYAFKVIANSWLLEYGE